MKVSVGRGGQCSQVSAFVAYCRVCGFMLYTCGLSLRRTQALLSLGQAVSRTVFYWSPHQMGSWDVRFTSWTKQLMKTQEIGKREAIKNISGLSTSSQIIL